MNPDKPKTPLQKDVINSQPTNNVSINDLLAPQMIHTNSLESSGWEKTGNATYSKQGREITFDGVNWWIDGHKVLTITKLNHYLKTGKII